MIRRFHLVVVSCLVLAVGLAAEEEKEKDKTADGGGNGSGATVQPAAEPKPEAKADSSAYVIGPEDILLIRVWREPELSGQVIVRPDGKVTIQLLGEIQAAGLTPEDLAAVIRTGLAASYLNKPEVTVTVLQVNSKKYYIQGEVIRAGAYPLLIPTTVLEALVNAGGFRDFADQKGIFIMRGGTRYKFNYKEVIKNKKMEQNILLQPGDHIIVP